MFSRLLMFFAGLGVGLYSAKYMRTIIKEAIKGGIQAGKSLRDIQAEVGEDLEDLTAEATDELASKGTNSS